MAQQDTDVFSRLERFYDAVPRDGAVAEDIGGLVLFVRRGAGWPYYARPRLAADQAPSAADITAVRQRQRDLGAPETFEWVHETTPDLLAVARSAGLSVLLAPLMVLEIAALVPDLPLPGATIRLLDPASPSFAADLSASQAVGELGFRTPASSALSAPLADLAPDPADPGRADSPAAHGSADGPTAYGRVDGPARSGVDGTAERDAVPPADVEVVAEQRRRAGSGRLTLGVVESPSEGVLASGVLQRVDSVAEVAGVATLPSARRRGFASQLTAALARHALHNDVDLVFLSAGDDDIARLYSRVGFRRIGTACIASPTALL